MFYFNDIATCPSVMSHFRVLRIFLVARIFPIDGFRLSKSWRLENKTYCRTDYESMTTTTSMPITHATPLVLHSTGPDGTKQEGVWEDKEVRKSKHICTVISNMNTGFRRQNTRASSRTTRCRTSCLRWKNCREDPRSLH